MCKAKLKGANLRELKMKLKGALLPIQGVPLPTHIDNSFSVYLFLELEP